NHLDIQSKEILENALSNYTGTIIYVSHDRYFIDKTADFVYELTENGITKYLGNFTYYMEKKAKMLAESVTIESSAPKHTSLKEERLLKKEQEAKERKLRNAIAKIEKEIEDAENKIAEYDEMLLSEEVSCDSQKANEIFTKKTEIEEKLASLYDEWEQLQS
ncbi:MAG: ABC-F family ATP-binding cassette domain-containing protein, partial [Firmicutes bacterium]|nr:ABC-F family ATP-binding cassette domain-containing protein [Bacillota bacterium]